MIRLIRQDSRGGMGSVGELPGDSRSALPVGQIGLQYVSSEATIELKQEGSLPIICG